MKQFEKSIQTLTPELAYIIGVLLGDGHISKNGIILMVKDKDFILNFKKKFEKWINYKLKLKRYKQNNDKYYWCIYFYSKNLCSFLTNYLLSFLKKIKSFSKKYQIAFLEGLYDSEGSVFNAISFFNTNLKIIKIVKILLLKFKINSHISLIKRKKLSYKLCYNLSISRKIDILKFQKLIHFSIKRKQSNLKKFRPNFNDTYIPKIRY